MMATNGLTPELKHLVDFIVVGNDNHERLLGSIGFNPVHHSKQVVKIQVIDKETGRVVKERSVMPAREENPYPLSNFGKLTINRFYILQVMTPEGQILDREVFRVKRK